VTETRNTPSAPQGSVGHRRWIICALLFFATTTNYLDRSVIGVLAPALMAHFGWTKGQYAYFVTNGFQISYTAGLLAAGYLIDRLSTRRGFSLFVFFWSAAGVATGFASGLWTFAAARCALGLSEGGNFPAGVKTVAEWFPRRERALATGIFNSGTSIGSILAPFIGVYVYIHCGWRWPFIITGVLGFVWIGFWLALYKRPHEDTKVTQGELAHILRDGEEPAQKIPWSRVIVHRQAWAFAFGKFLTDPVWWFWMFWIAIFLKDRFNTTLEGSKWPLVVIYTAATVGGIFGGWLSSALLKAGWSVNAARKTAMLVFALLVVPVIGALFTTSLWTAVGLVALAGAAHQAWSCNVFTLASDMFPRRAVGSVAGLGGMMGSLGSVLLNIFAGGWLKGHKDSYLPFFLIAGFGYLFALLVIHTLAPKLEPAKID